MVIMGYQIGMIWVGIAFTFYESILGFEQTLDDCQPPWAFFYFLGRQVADLNYSIYTLDTYTNI